VGARKNTEKMKETGKEKGSPKNSQGPSKNDNGPSNNKRGPSKSSRGKLPQEHKKHSGEDELREDNRNAKVTINSNNGQQPKTDMKKGVKNGAGPKQPEGKWVFVGKNHKDKNCPQKVSTNVTEGRQTHVYRGPPQTTAKPRVKTPEVNEVPRGRGRETSFKVGDFRKITTFVRGSITSPGDTTGHIPLFSTPFLPFLPSCGKVRNGASWLLLALIVGPTGLLILTI